MSRFPKNPTPVFISFPSLPNNLIGHVIQCGGLFWLSQELHFLDRVHFVILLQELTSIKKTLSHWCYICVLRVICFKWIYASSCMLQLQFAFVLAAKNTIGSFWYDLAWQCIISDATMCHSTEIEELISLHQSPAFYKYSKALCSRSPSLPFCLPCCFLCSTPPSLSFSLPSLCLSIFFPTHSLPPTSFLFSVLLWCNVERCASCLSRKRQ